MVVLEFLTIIYAVVLVLVLAISLIAILVVLTRIGKTIGQLAAGLRAVEAQTLPLEGHLEVVNGALTSVAGGMKSVYGHLAGADEALGRVGDALIGQGG